ncbi:MAG TPA: hypothetical protein VL985_09615 [Stellaceae bacterium]|nr:hypothetical protein [Stellaceae bacterium]
MRVAIDAPPARQMVEQTHGPLIGHQQCSSDWKCWKSGARHSINDNCSAGIAIILTGSTTRSDVQAGVGIAQQRFPVRQPRRNGQWRNGQ